MSNCNCGPKYSCTDISIAASLLVGIIAAVLSFTAVITVAPVFLWVVLGVAVGFLAITLLTSAAESYAGARSCVCRATNLLLTGVLGAVLVSVILLAVTFAATSILGTVLVGALLFFFSLILTSAACLIKYKLGCGSCAD